MDDRRVSNLGTGIGLVLGTGIGAVLVLAVGIAPLSSLSYGAGGGITVGALAGRLVRANRGEENVTVRATGGCAVVGSLVGSGLGAIGAAAVGVPLWTGAAVGAVAGLGHGFAVGALLVSTIDIPAAGNE